MPSSSSSRKSKRSDYTPKSRHLDRWASDHSSNTSLTSATMHRRAPQTSTRRRSHSSDNDITTRSRKKSSSSRNGISGVVSIVALCLLNTVGFQNYLQKNGDYYLRGRRLLLGPPKLTEEQIAKSRSNYLFPVDYSPDKTATTIAWFDQAVPHAEKMMDLYQCVGDTIAVHSRHGAGDKARYQLYQSENQITNLDLPSFQDVMSSDRDLLILTNEPYDTLNQLFNRDNRGRMLALFSHPIHRTIQRFLERSGKSRMSLLKWLSSPQNVEENIIVKKLLGKRPLEQVDLVDLEIAKEFIRHSVVVGLSSEIEESFNRFNAAMGFEKRAAGRNAKCLEDLFSKNDLGIDKFAQMFSPESKEWKVIARRNYLDMALYTYAEKLFQEYDGIYNLFPQDVEDDYPDTVDVSTGAPQEITSSSVEQHVETNDSSVGSVQQYLDTNDSSVGSVQQYLGTDDSTRMQDSRIVKESPYVTQDGAASAILSPIAPQEIPSRSVEQQLDTINSNVEQHLDTNDSTQKQESRIADDSPYATPPNVVENSAVGTAESEVTQNEIDANVPDTQLDPKRAIKRRLVDVSSFVFGHGKDATPFFWHVPKAGGTAIQNLYWCMGLTLANEVGGNPKLLERTNVPRDVLTVFQPWKNSGNMAKIINIDVTTHKGIENAEKLGFLTQKGQPKTDFVSSSLFHVVSMKLFSKDNKARMFALFRHPVERAVSKFFYLSKATWEPTYDETWANMTLEEWATNDRGENNWLTHHLSGKKHYEPVDRNDLEIAKEMIQTKFIVGLMNKFDESVHRFNLLLGVNENESTNQQCMSDFVQTDSTQSKKNDLSNRNSYTKAQEGSVAWSMISDINYLDVELFSFIEEQFKAQSKLFEQYEAQRIIFDQLQAQQGVKTD